MSNYIKSGNIVRIHPGDAIETSKQLFPAVYKIELINNDPVLSQVGQFELPNRLLGDVEKRADRIINTFMDRKGRNTGVLMSGLKGSGKSLLAKLVSSRLLSQGFPTIILDISQINSGFCGYIGSIDTECVVMIDELDKVDNGDQLCLLSLLDGTSTSRKLFLLTCNNKWNVTDWLLNRPGRVFYNFHYSGLDEEIIRQYCMENLKNQEYVNDIVLVSKSIQDVSFDILVSIVEECNRYDQSPREFIDFMSFHKAEDIKYNIFLSFDGIEVAFSDSSLDAGNNFDPEEDSVRFGLVENVCIPGWNDEAGIREAVKQLKDCTDDEDDAKARAKRYASNVIFHPKDISEVVDGVVTYTRNDGWECVLIPDFKSRYNPYGFFGRYRRDAFAAAVTPSKQAVHGITHTGFKH